MTVTLIKKPQPPNEARLRRMLTLSDDVRVRDVRSGCEGILWRVERASVMALMGSMTFRIRLEHLALVEDEAASSTAKQ